MYKNFRAMIQLLRCVSLLNLVVHYSCILLDNLIDSPELNIKPQVFSDPHTLRMTLCVTHLHS